MKYIYGFLQSELVRHKLKLEHTIVLFWFLNWYYKKGEKGMLKTEDGFAWVSYEKVLNDLPILGVTNLKSVQRVFKKLTATNLLQKKMIRERTRGTLVCYKPTHFIKFLVPERLE